MKFPASPSPGLFLMFSGVLTLPAFSIVSIDSVPVGNVGNAADPATGGLYGAVAYACNISKNETTIRQYAEFLNEVAGTDTYDLYHTNMANLSHIAGISRGGTESGAYTLDGAMSGFYVANQDARFWIPTESESYKAAYYDPTKGDAGGYCLNATQSDQVKNNTIGVPGASNYSDGDYVGYPGMALTDVGAYGANSDSYYGTNDQAGNVIEWTDGIYEPQGVVRGGSWGYNVFWIRSLNRA